MADLFTEADPPTPKAYTQQMELFEKVYQMQKNATPEWLEFFELVRAMMKAEAVARTGIAHGQIKAERTRRPLHDLFREWDEQERMPEVTLNLSPPGE